MKHIQVPGDGRCLFHSIAQHVQEPTDQVLAKLFFFQDHQGDSRVKSSEAETFQDWIRMEQDMDIAEYTRKLKQGHWGGLLDCMALSKIYGRDMIVQTPWTTLEIVSDLKMCFQDPVSVIRIYQNGFSHQNAVDL